MFFGWPLVVSGAAGFNSSACINNSSVQRTTNGSKDEKSPRVASAEADGQFSSSLNRWKDFGGFRVCVGRWLRQSFQESNRCPNTKRRNISPNRRAVPNLTSAARCCRRRVKLSLCIPL